MTSHFRPAVRICTALARRSAVTTPRATFLLDTMKNLQEGVREAKDEGGGRVPQGPCRPIRALDISAPRAHSFCFTALASPTSTNNTDKSSYFAISQEG